jgi:hypothetical protein
MDESQRFENKKLHVFISYSRQDIEFVDRLQAALRGARLPVGGRSSGSLRAGMVASLALGLTSRQQCETG